MFVRSHILGGARAKMGQFWFVLGYIGVILGGGHDKSLCVWVLLGNGDVIL